MSCTPTPRVDFEFDLSAQMHHKIMNDIGMGHHCDRPNNLNLNKIDHQFNTVDQALGKMWLGHASRPNDLSTRNLVDDHMKMTTPLVSQREDILMPVKKPLFDW